MTTTAAPHSTTQSNSFGEDDDDTLKRVEVNLNPSPASQPLQYLQVSYQSRGGSKSSNPQQIPPTQGDVFLIKSLDGGRCHDIATQAGNQPLPPLSDTEEEEVSGPSTTRLKRRERVALSPPMLLPSTPSTSLPKSKMSHSLQLMAAAGLAAAECEPEPVSPPPATPGSVNGVDRLLVVRAPHQYSSPRQSPGHPDPLHSNLEKLDIRSPTTNDNRDEQLRPMLSAAISDSSGNHHNLPLPSIRSTLGDIHNLPESNHHPPSLSSPHYGQPTQGLIKLSPMPIHTSPPISPNDRFRDMPSPSGRPLANPSPYYPYQSSGAPPGRHSVDYSSSSPTETPGSEQSASTPSVADRMSIDNMTNPVGTFVCNFMNCKASPFQTQYLLNSHANVHSSSRPHYCPVNECPRAEGGKGFKRKNEMIRHGLVHASPGYVCPFCPDRERKYPRPDNLQRHARAHHPEKDKEDPALRDVLAQRPDGPNRGRRRRGGQPG